MNPSSSSSSLFGPNLTSSTSNQNLNGFRNLYQQQAITNNCGSNNGGSSSAGSGIIANLDTSKHVHTFRNQFNNINGLEQQVQPQQQQHEHLENLNLQDLQQQQQPLQQQQQHQQQNLLNTSGRSAPSNMENFEQQQEQQANVNLPNSAHNSNFIDNNSNLNDDELFNYNNSNCNNVAAIFGSPDFRNMNFNFAINEFHKKIPFKTPCNSSTKRSRNSQSSPLNEVHFTQRMMNNGGIQQQNESCEDLTAIRHMSQRTNATGAAGSNTGSGRDFNEFGFGINNIDRNLGARRVEGGAVGVTDIGNQNDIPEEMKRNLLVNAFKNDKFTSKFFESLREDVCREVHSIMQRTETDPQCLLQLFKEIQNYNLYKRSHSNGTESNDDDNNELYGSSIGGDVGGGGFENDNENENQQQQAELLLSQQEQQNRQQQQQLQQQQQTLLSPPPPSLHYNNNSNQLQFQNLKDSTNIDDARSENNRDNEILNSLINSQDLRRLAYKIMFESASTPMRSEKDKKIGLKYDMMMTPQRNSPKIPNEVYRPDYELVNYVMSNIRHNIRQSHIDDETMVRIARLTASVLENPVSSSSLPYLQPLLTPQLSSSPSSSCSIQIDRNLISPKELYRRMKTFDVRDRDNFLARYETYLQTLFVMKISNEGSNNVNLISKKSLDNTMSTLGEGRGMGRLSRPNINLSVNTQAENIHNIRKIPQNSKSNIPQVTTASLTSALNLAGRNELNVNKKQQIESTSDNTHPSGFTTMVNGNVERQHQQNDLATTTTGPDTTATMFFRNSAVHQHKLSEASLSTSVANAATITAGVTSSKDQIISPNAINNSNNIMNEDLAEADQICSSNNSNICSSSGCDDGNCLISLQRQTDNGSSLPQSSSLLSQSHRLQQYPEAVGNYLNDYQQAPHQIHNINSTTSNNSTGTDHDYVENLAANYSNFMHESHNVHPSSTSPLPSSLSQHPERHDLTLVENGVFESQFFKKYWDGVRGTGNRNGTVEMNCGVRGRGEGGGAGSGKIVGSGGGSSNSSIKHDNSAIGILEHGVVEEEIEDGCAGNVGGNIDDDDGAGDDDDDEEEDDRAQFMMTDAACALVFPMVPAATTNTRVNSNSNGNLLLHNSSLNCMQADSSTGDFDGIGTSSAATVAAAVTTTPASFVGDVTTKRNSVP